jgi:rfaE bifunctional protein kinase chain/domain
MALAASIEQYASDIDAVLCSDYLSGLLSEELVAAIKDICREHRLLLTVDAQGEIYKYAGASLVRCNNHEASSFLGRRLDDEAGYRTGLPEMLRRLEVELVVVTRGGEGVSLIGRNLPYTYLPAHRVEVADVTGAGDTFIAVLTLALAAGIEPVDAGTLANSAAALVVQRIGNAVVTPDELRSVIVEQSKDGSEH